MTTKEPQDIPGMTELVSEIRVLNERVATVIDRYQDLESRMRATEKWRYGLMAALAILAGTDVGHLLSLIPS